MAIKTYQVMVKEEATWDLEVEATSHKEAKKLAVHEVANNDWGYFPMFDNIRYKICDSWIKEKYNNGN
jgi:hypothetical protein